ERDEGQPRRTTLRRGQPIGNQQADADAERGASRHDESKRGEVQDELFHGRSCRSSQASCVLLPARCLVRQWQSLSLFHIASDFSETISEFSSAAAEKVSRFCTVPPRKRDNPVKLLEKSVGIPIAKRSASNRRMDAWRIFT